MGKEIRYEEKEEEAQYCWYHTKKRYDY